MKEFSIPMALFDYIPVVLFFLGTDMVAKDLKHSMNSFTYTAFRIGTILVFLAGALKATYKLLYAAGIGDFTWMSSQFFSNEAFGFLIAGIALTLFTTRAKGRLHAFLPTMALVGIMVVGVGAMNASLANIASRMKKKSAVICFIVSFFLDIGMGYLSSKNFDQAYMNWVAEIVNLAGQVLFWYGCKILHDHGLKSYE